MEGKTLADRIENYIKWMLTTSADGIIELQRQELAEHFTCVPSQVTYVLSTRFTVERGYLVESRRGGGGYIRIVRVPLKMENELKSLVNEFLGESMTQETAVELLNRLVEEGLLTKREALLLEGALSRQALPLELPQRDRIRALILKSVILSLLSEGFPD